MTFGEWLETQMRERGLGVRELGRLSGVGTGTISRLLSESRGVGPDVCQKLARALGLPEIVVFVQAGLMSQTANTEELTLRELYAILSELPPAEQRAILAEARARYRGAQPVQTQPDPSTS